MIEKIYAEIPLCLKYIVWGVAIVQFLAIAIKALFEALPKWKNKKVLDEAIEDYLKQPSYKEGPLESHLQEMRAALVFKRLTGVKCKKEMREALIALHDRAQDSWSWGFLSSAYSHLEVQKGELRIRVSWIERIFQAFLYASSAMFFGLACIFHMSTVVLAIQDVRTVTLMEVSTVFCFGFGFCFLFQALPLERG